MREVFTVSGADRKATKVSVRLRGRPGYLQVRLEQGDESLIEEGTVLVVGPSSEMKWVHLAFRSPHVLQAGHRYHIVLTAPEGESYQTFPLQEGTGDGFGCPSVFRDGFFQHTSGGPWLEHINKYCDLQFYFTLQQEE